MTESYDEYVARKGRPRTTGRYDTREKLEERVMLLYNNGGMNHHQIAVSVGVSDGVVTEIITEDTYLSKYTNGSKP